jgi:hypothetical protein
MFECMDCGALFTEPDTYRECVGEFWGTPAYESFPCCPHCKSDDFEEVEDNEDF